VKRYYLGIDIGGTSSKIGIIEEKGTILEKWEIPSKINGQTDQIPKKIWESIKIKLKKYSIDYDQIFGIGAGAPGFINAEKSEVAQAVNLGWIDYPLGRILHKISGLPVYIENDANIAALGENWVGSGAMSKNLIAITLGTGVGGGIIANGQILTGVNGTAGEFGHMTVKKDGYPCNCGRQGCLETIASATGISRIAEERITQFPSSILVTQFKEKNKLTSKDVFEAYELEDPCAIEVVNYVTDILGFAISNVAHVINPEEIVIGGGVSKAGKYLLDPIKKAYQKYTLPRTFSGSSFSIASLGNDAGIIGAAFLVKQKQEQNN